MLNLIILFETYQKIFSWMGKINKAVKQGILSYHRCERTTMAAKSKILVNVTDNVIGIFIHAYMYKQKADRLMAQLTCV